MALLASNSPLQGMRGSLGGLVFRSFNGKTVVSAEPYIRRIKPKDQTDRQRQTRSNFKEATQYAKKILRDDRMREHYQRQARKLKLPNAYTAAITEYMRKNKPANTTHTGKAVEPAIVADLRSGIRLPSYRQISDPCVKTDIKKITQSAEPMCLHHHALGNQSISRSPIRVPWLYRTKSHQT